MQEPSQNILEFLEQLRRERDDLISLVAGLERKLGIVPQPADGPTSSTLAAPESPRVRVSIDSIPVGFFHNLSQPAAAEKLLRLSPGQPLTTSEILSCFRKSGIELNPKNASTILYTALSRNPKFERVAGKAWGLSDWYPENRRKEKAPSGEAASQEPEA